MNERITISIDYQEIPSGIPFLLSTIEEAELTIQKMSVGDYQIGGSLVIERKSHLDFIRSLIDGRLFQQAGRLSSLMFPVCILLEGKGAIPRKGKMRKEAIEGALLSLNAFFQIPIIGSEDPFDSARIIQRLTQLEFRNRKRDVIHRNRWGYKPRGVKKQKLYFLEGLPGVGPKLAQEILAEFGSIEAFIQASEREWQVIKGLGEKKTKIFKEVLGYLE